MSKTHVAIILDKSGSMSSTRDHTISGFNEQISQIKLNAAENPGNTTVTLVTFNGDVFEHLLMAPAEQLEEADPSFYKCEGATAMYDAIGYTIKKIAEAAAPDDNVLITTISDGDENGSKHYHADQLHEEIESRQATGRWTFSYMGCTAASLDRVSKSTGIPISNMAAWSNHTPGASKRAMTGVSKRMGSYLRAKAESPDKAMVSNLYADSADTFVDYTKSVDGEAVKLNDAVISEGLGAESMGFVARGATFGGGNKSFMAARPISSRPAAPSAPPVVDRPEDLELRVGKSDVFGKGTKANW